MNEKEKLLQMIEENESIIRYKKLEKLINEHKEIKGLMGQLKLVQKQLVNAKHIGKTEAIKDFQNRYDTLYEALESYPLMSDYLALQGEINDLLQTIVSIVETGIEDEFK